MKTSGTLTEDLYDIGLEARVMEQHGADIACALEIGHDPIIQLALAASATERIGLMPSNIEYGAPQVLVAAVGPLMTENAAEVADGILLHTFTTEEYIRTVTLPAMEAGLAKSGRSRSELQLVATPFFVTGETEEQFSQVKLSARKQLALYGSTPAYREVLESVGYGELQPELHSLSKAGRWAEMGELIDDPLLDKLALVGEPDELSQKLARRFGDIFDVCSASVFSGDVYTAGGFNKTITDAIRQSAG